MKLRTHYLRQCIWWKSLSQFNIAFLPVVQLRAEAIVATYQAGDYSQHCVYFNAVVELLLSISCNANFSHWLLKHFTFSKEIDRCI